MVISPGGMWHTSPVPFQVFIYSYFSSGASPFHRFPWVTQQMVTWDKSNRFGQHSVRLVRLKKTAHSLVAKSKRCWDDRWDASQKQCKSSYDDLRCTGELKATGSFALLHVLQTELRILRADGFCIATERPWALKSDETNTFSRGVKSSPEPCIVYRQTHTHTQRRTVTNEHHAWTHARPAAVMYIVSTSIPHSHIFPYLSPPQDYTAGSLTPSLQKKKSKKLKYSPPPAPPSLGCLAAPTLFSFPPRLCCCSLFTSQVFLWSTADGVARQRTVSWLCCAYLLGYIGMWEFLKSFFFFLVLD